MRIKKKVEDVMWEVFFFVCVNVQNLQKFIEVSTYKRSSQKVVINFYVPFFLVGDNL